MQINEMFKAIKLRIKTSKPYVKDLYGENCREFIFEDCYGNDVGVFIVHPQGDVCQVVVNAMVEDNTSKEILTRMVTYRWINPLAINSRKFILSAKSQQEQLRELYVHSNVMFENIQEKDIMLNIVSCIAEGKNYILQDKETNVDLTNEELKETFLSLAKAAYKKNISIDSLVKSLLDMESNSDNSSVSSQSHVNQSIEKVERNTYQNSSNNESIIKSHNFNSDFKNFGYKMLGDNNGLTGSGVKKFIESKSPEVVSVTDCLVAKIDSNSVDSIPEYLNGTFEIGRGFVPKNSKVIKDIGMVERNKKDESIKKDIQNKDYISFSDSKLIKKANAEISRQDLKEKVLPIISNVDLSDGIKNHIHRYPGEKTVLSNLKVIF